MTNAELTGFERELRELLTRALAVVRDEVCAGLAGEVVAPTSKAALAFHGRPGHRAANLRERLSGLGSAAPPLSGLGSAAPPLSGLGSAAPPLSGQKSAHPLSKAGTDWEAQLDALEIDFDAYLDDIEGILARVAQAGADGALDDLRDYLEESQGRAFSSMVNQVNQEAVDWAGDSAARLVTDISDTTREMLREQIASGIERGLSVKELASEIYDGQTFSAHRAELIAVTELAEANVRGNKLAWAKSGLVKALQWSADDAMCDDCQMNDGAIVPMGPDGMAAEAYPSGAWGVPAHPRCRCNEIPVLTDEWGDVVHEEDNWDGDDDWDGDDL